MCNLKKTNINEDSLILLFNDRNPDFFGSVYNILYRELHYYANTVFFNTQVEPSDIIHDIFIKIWSNNELQFKSLLSIKLYIFTAIKNNYKDYYKHLSIVSVHQNEKINQLSYDEIIESELYILIEEQMKMLPFEWSEILKMYIDGWSYDDIAEHFGKEKRTIYNIRQKAITRLKELTTGLKYTLSIFLLTII